MRLGLKLAAFGIAFLLSKTDLYFSKSHLSEAQTASELSLPIAHPNVNPTAYLTVSLGWVPGLHMLLGHMRERLFRCDTFESAIWTILDDAIGLLGAEYGNLQLLIGQELVIAAQRGLPPDFLKSFRRVTKDDGSACGRALLFGKPVVIPDVEKDLEFAIYRNIARRTHFRAVQSTPLIAQYGQQLGIVSTHFANPHHPSKIEMDSLQAYGITASQYAFELLHDKPLDLMASRMSDVLYDSLAIPL